MKLSDYVADYLATLNERVYGIVGAGAMHLNDSICNHPRLKFIAMHHEQAAAMAAEADARVSGKIGLVHVTAGPGGTNAITGIAGAWVDSIPMMVIAGQVGTTTLKGDRNLRQLGTNELGLVEMVKSITKYAVTVTNSRDIRRHLNAAAYLAQNGRPGPVWIEIPLDVQSADIDPVSLVGFTASIQRLELSDTAIAMAWGLLSQSQRPLILAGNGIHLAGAESEFGEFVHASGIPVVTSWNGIDLLPTADDLVIGRPGLFGDRAGNFAIQNADVILAIGTRLSIPQVGHHPSLFAPGAKIIHVDIDRHEFDKPTVSLHLPIMADAKLFLARMPAIPSIGGGAWHRQCLTWKAAYQVMQPGYREAKNGVNSYAFVEELGKSLDDDAIIVTDVGAAFISTMQSLKLRGTQRLFHSGGVSAMGYGIPAAIGACQAGGGRQVICLVGDGGAMVNIQELQTIVHYKMPIAIFIFVNDGYMTMQYTQKTHFQREAASSPRSGMSCPDFRRIGEAFGIPSGTSVEWVLNVDGPAIGIVYMPREQLLIPRVQSKMKDGKFVPVALDDMWPPIERAVSA